eukprot:765687-Hanusia_phi.AAC.2
MSRRFAEGWRRREGRGEEGGEGRGGESGNDEGAKQDRGTRAEHSKRRSTSVVSNKQTLLTWFVCSEFSLRRAPDTLSILTLRRCERRLRANSDKQGREGGEHWKGKIEKHRKEDRLDKRAIQQNNEEEKKEEREGKQQQQQQQRQRQRRRRRRQLTALEDERILADCSLHLAVSVQQSPCLPPSLPPSLPPPSLAVSGLPSSGPAASLTAPPVLQNNVGSRRRWWRRTRTRTRTRSRRRGEEEEE